MKPTVGIDVALRAYGDELADVASQAVVVEVDAGTAIRSGLSALVVFVDDNDEGTFRHLRQCRADQPTTPVIVVATALPPNVAVELVKLGVTDCMCLPAPPDMLWRKVERAILGSGGPTVDSPLLSLLWDAKDHPAHEEKRRCFRSGTVANYPAHVTVVSPTTLPRMVVKDLSILTEGCPGGFALVGTNVHVHALQEQASCRFVLDVPEFPKPIPCHGVVKRVIQSATASDPAAILGVEYRVDDAAHEAPVRRYWSESQRKVAALARKTLGAIE